MAILINEPTATPSQDETSILFTSGSAVNINCPASKAFATILDTSTYEHWNTTNPHVKFPSNPGGHSLLTPEAPAELSFLMSPNSSPIKVPIRVLAVHQDDTTGVYRLEWQGQMLPSWLGRAERVQTVRSVGPDTCELRQWESMSGWGVRILDWIFGTRKQLDAANMRYAEDLKRFMEA